MIYLDYNATTPTDERVLAEMLPYFSQKFGNAASNTHSFGWEASEAVKQAREQVAAAIGAVSSEIIFTSGATEAINIALKGIAEMYAEVGNHIITCKTEHKAVLDTCAYLEEKGLNITYLDVNENGLIDLTELENAFTPQTILVCIMYANNETGVLQPIQAISEITHQKGAIFMSDCVQAVGKIPVNVQDLGIDVMPISAHKVYGPKGVGALYIRRRNPRVALTALLHGGGHEKGLRSGTLNVPGIVGLGKALELATTEMESFPFLGDLRNHLENSLLQIPDVSRNGDANLRLPHVSNLSFGKVKADSLIMKLPNIALSTGSACTSALISPSHVLAAMGFSEERCYASIRFSLGKSSTMAEIEATIQAFNHLFER